MMLTALLLASIGLRGHTTCPTVQEVSDRLAGLDSDSSGDLRWVELSSQSDHLQLSLWGTDGSLEAVRELPLPASCDALARASAVTIATWASRREPSRVQSPEPPRPVHTIFDPETLAAERLRIALSEKVEPPPSPRRLRGSVIMLTLGFVAQLAGGAVTLVGHDPGNGVFFLGVGSPVAIAGMVWLWAALTRREPSEAVAF